MKRFTIPSPVLFLLLPLFFFLLSCASGHKAVLPDDTPSVRSLQKMKTHLSGIVRSSSRLTMQTIGQVEYGSFTAPVQVISFAPKGKADYRILIDGGVHGNEPAGVEAVMDLVQRVAKQPGKYKNVSFDFIVCVNPWGWAHDIRFNKEGRDVNRDFASFKSQEAGIIRDFVKGKTYDLIIDHHEDPSGKGFYMYQYAKPDQILSRAVIDSVRKAGYPIEQDINMILLKTDDGLIDAPKWGLWYMKLSRQLSMTNYFRLNISDNVYTVETPTMLAPKDRLDMHRIAQHMIIDDLIKKQK